MTTLLAGKLSKCFIDRKKDFLVQTLSTKRSLHDNKGIGCNS